MDQLIPHNITLLFIHPRHLQSLIHQHRVQVLTHQLFIKRLIHNHNLFLKIEYTVSTVNQQTHLAEFPQMDSGLAVLVFKQGDDPIDAINKMISFLEKVLLVEAQGNDKVLNEEELEFLADPGIAEGPVTKSVITHKAAYQAHDLDAYDSDCDEISTAKAVLMANLSGYSSDVLSKYLSETQNAAVQDTNSSAQQDVMILYVFEQLSKQVTNCNKVNKDNLMANETLSAELKRYKEREKEAKSIDNEITLEKKVKELDNIMCKMGQSAQTVHMLTKPQVFYDNNLKQTLGFQNPFYLKKAQQIRPILYDGSAITKEINVISIADSEETLMLEDESRSKMLLKQSDPLVLEKKVNIKPVNYALLNQLSEDFGKCFVPQQELSAEQAFWFQMSNPSTESYEPSLVKVDVPSELPKVSLVNESLKKLESHLTKFESVVKTRITPFALTEDLLNEITKVKIVFDQMETIVQQYSVDKRCLETANNQVLSENDRLLEQIISQDIVNIVVNSFVDINDSGNANNCNKCLKLRTELFKKRDFIEKEIYDKLFKSYFTLEQHCISLEVSSQLNQEIFQRDNSALNQSAPNFNQYFELNELKAQLQEKDTVICKLKERIKSLTENANVEYVSNDISELETKNVELEHSVAKFLSENERLCNEINHVKQVLKDQFDSIKKTRVRNKEQSDSLIDKLNLTSVENEDLKAQIQDKVFVITSLKNDLRKLNGK
ncbi:hypothetical protein Tco_0535127 [Tanacetum coccineum]